MITFVPAFDFSKTKCPMKIKRNKRHLRGRSSSEHKDKKRENESFNLEVPLVDLRQVTPDIL